MGNLNKTLNKAILGSRKSDGELMLDSVSVEKNSTSFDKAKMIGLDLSSEACKLIPSFIAASSAFKARDILGSNDVYKVVLKNGITPDSVKSFLTNKDGKLITSYLDVNGNFNQAGLEKINSELLKPINTVGFAAAVAGVMQVLSFAVGEYYRCEINNKLETIQNDIKDIKQFLKDEKSSFVAAAIDTFNKYMQDMTGELSDGQKQSYSNEVQSIILKSRELKELARKRAEEIVSQINKSNKIKIKSLDEMTDNIKLYLSWYEDSVKLMIYGEFIFSRLNENSSSIRNSIAEANKNADIWKEMNISIQEALNGKGLSGFDFSKKKNDLKALLSFINNNLNENKLHEESKLLIANNMMYFNQAELYFQDGKMYIPNYEYFSA